MSDDFENDDFEGDDFEDDDFEDDDSESRVRFPSIDDLLATIKSGHKDEALKTINALPDEWVITVVEKLAASEGDRTQRLRFDLAVMDLMTLNFDIDHHIDDDIAMEIGESIEKEMLENFTRAFELARALGYELTFDFSQPRGPEYAHALMRELEEAEQRIAIPELPLLVAAGKMNREYYAGVAVGVETYDQLDDGYLQKLSDALSESASLYKQAPSDTLDVIAQALQDIAKHNDPLPPPSRN